jgi:hypothetical protein
MFISGEVGITFMIPLSPGITIQKVSLGHFLIFLLYGSLLSTIRKTKKSAIGGLFGFISGEGGIRTRGTVTRTTV